MRESGSDWSLPPLRKGTSAAESIFERRRQLARLATLHVGDPEVSHRESDVGGVRCHLLGEERASATLLYFHGGGYRLGDPVTWLGFLSVLASLGGFRIIVPDYRLAPENPFPAALHDAVAVYRAVLDEGPAVRVAIGDSAGGGLAAALTVAADANDQPAPDGLILLSPWLDLTVTSTTYDSHAALDELFSRASAQEAADLYLQGQSPELELASPLMADPAIFPPTQIFCGGKEVLLGDSLTFVDQLAKANHRVEAHFVPSMQHVWPMIAPELPESEFLRSDIVRFVHSLAR